ncbi:early nodulin-like protein 15 [Bidens hawaiensis]|uniref:early nodulin-like protein 15 n=1 Tax=Bidens hawaiensis TaxID=980011 RepID=UPI00404B934F
MASSSTLFRLFFFTVTVISSVSADLFVVGGAFGWEVPDNDTQFYYVWAIRRHFMSVILYVSSNLVGSVLLWFRYSPVDKLLIIREWAFPRCDNRRPAAVFKGGDTLINLDNAGAMFFISGDPRRCRQGLKMALEVYNADPEDTNSSVALPPSISNATVPSHLSPAPSLSDSTVWFAVYKFVTALIVIKFNL